MQANIGVEVSLVFHSGRNFGENRSQQLFSGSFAVTAGNTDFQQLWKLLHILSSQELQRPQRVLMGENRNLYIVQIVPVLRGLCVAVSDQYRRGTVFNRLVDK